MSEKFEARNLYGDDPSVRNPGGVWRIVRKEDGKSVTPQEAGLGGKPEVSEKDTNEKFRPICTMNIASHQIVVFAPWWPGMPGSDTDGAVCLAWVEMSQNVVTSEWFAEARFALFAPETAGLAEITDHVRIIGGKTDVGTFGRNEANWPINIPTVRDIRSVLKFVNEA